MERYSVEEMTERLNISVNRINGGYYIWARKHGLQENRLTILYALGDKKKHTQTEISREWLIPKTTVNTVVKQLARENIVLIQGGEKSKELSLTEYGVEYTKAALANLYRAEKDAMACILERYGEAFITAHEEYSAILESKLKTDYETGQ